MTLIPVPNKTTYILLIIFNLNNIYEAVKKNEN